jgi:hypothetical protein
MSEISGLLDTAKKLLKAKGLAYRDVAKALKISEPSVKRMFALERFTLERLAEVAALLDLTLAELAQAAADRRPRIRTLASGQEAALAADAKLLLVAVCALNHWEASDIAAFYRLTPAECTQKLLQLDRMRLIELLPGNRIRLMIARDFDWLPNGPIRRFFRAQGQDDFLDCPFTGNGEAMTFVHGMFTEAAFAQLQPELQRLRRRFAELHEESLSAPLANRSGASMLLAARRSWEPPAFAKLRRKSPG